MKRNLLIFALFLLTNSIFSETILDKIRKPLEESGLYSFSKEELKETEKPFIKFSFKSKDDYIKQIKNPWIRKDLFPKLEAVTYEKIIQTYKDCINIYDLPPLYYYNYSWRVGKKIEYAVVYSQNTYYPITGPGSYSILIFDSNYVYMIDLSIDKIIDEPNSEYDALSDFFVYNKGHKADKSKGLEQSQGYFCFSEDKAKLFYDKLQKNDSLLPESAKRLQEGLLFLEDILNNY